MLGMSGEDDEQPARRSAGEETVSAQYCFGEGVSYIVVLWQWRSVS